MSWTKTEARLRDALMATILPAPGRGLPAIEDVDLRSFWVRFDAAAPVHLRLGLRAAHLGEAIMQFAEHRVLLLVDAPEGPAEDGDEAIGTGGL